MKNLTPFFSKSWNFALLLLTLSIPLFAQYECQWGQSIFPGSLSVKVTATDQETFFNGPSCLTTDGLGNSYVAGQLGTANGHADMYMAKYDAGGNQLWFRLFNSLGSLDIPTGITVRGKMVYLSGHFTGKVDFDLNGDFGANDPAGKTIGDQTVGFIARYRDLGNQVVYDHKVAFFNAEERVLTHGLAQGPNGNLAIVGNSRGDIYVNGQEETVEAIGNGNLDAFVLYFNPELDFDWGLINGSLDGDDQGLDVVIDNDDQIFISGSFRNTIIFHEIKPGGSKPQSAVPGMLKSVGDNPYHAFLAKYSVAGELDWTVIPQGENNQSNGQRLAVDGERVYMAGRTKGNVEFYPGIKSENDNTINVYVAAFNKHGLEHADAYWINCLTTGNSDLENIYDLDIPKGDDVVTLLYGQPDGTFVDRNLVIHFFEKEKGKTDVKLDPIAIPYNRLAQNSRHFKGQLCYNRNNNRDFILATAYWTDGLDAPQPEDYLDLNNGIVWPHANIPVQSSIRMNGSLIARFIWK
ncbi:hypothetical protein [Flavilitoribacter nigricans]|uniref:Uncharacterized protein n=1 Tax=Flavilitoribacter nigricans (strain ATCC 23147 / DSM 23189 / NBRC 102662 / NCIMB 1420 / SS-2) TaxID=1122177 RepID=A0A2D0NH37_FLAN2|nr:hypothetical protein [Flavilitoribacter nigricans]PHN07805.1 hypothetical protein CRP01_04600 [Flavilitoribacter nigricans DSM 23189 = NBRC 102662]